MSGSTAGQIRPDGEALRGMLRSIEHRGPTPRGTFVDGAVALGSRRLSIIDLTGGSQPISNEDGTVVVVFNGEIYNYRELRAALRRRGHSLRSASDTEVIVHLYEELGEDCVRELDGMFAFALWDSRKRRLLLVGLSDVLCVVRGDRHHGLTPWSGAAKPVGRAASDQGVWAGRGHSP